MLRGKKNLDQISGNVSASNIKTSSQMRHGETFVHWANVSNTVTRIDHDSRQQSLCVKGQNGLDGHISTGESIFFKHHLR